MCRIAWPFVDCQDKILFGTGELHIPQSFPFWISDQRKQQSNWSDFFIDGNFDRFIEDRNWKALVKHFHPPTGPLTSGTSNSSQPETLQPRRWWGRWDRARQGLPAGLISTLNKVSPFCQKTVHWRMLGSFALTHPSQDVFWWTLLSTSGKHAPWQTARLSTKPKNSLFRSENFT